MLGCALSNALSYLNGIFWSIRFPDVSGIILRLPPTCTHTLLGLVTREDCVTSVTSPKEDCVGDE